MFEVIDLCPLQSDTDSAFFGDAAAWVHASHRIGIRITCQALQSDTDSVFFGDAAAWIHASHLIGIWFLFHHVGLCMVSCVYPTPFPTPIRMVVLTLLSV